MTWPHGRWYGSFSIPDILLGTLHGTGATTLFTGTPGAPGTGITITDIIVTGILTTTIITITITITTTTHITMIITTIISAIIQRQYTME